MCEEEAIPSALKLMRLVEEKLQIVRNTLKVKSFIFTNIYNMKMECVA